MAASDERNAGWRENSRQVRRSRVGYGLRRLRLTGPPDFTRWLVLAHALIDDLAHQALIGPGEILHLHDQFPGVVNRPAKSVTIKQIRARGAGSY